MRLCPPSDEPRIMREMFFIAVPCLMAVGCLAWPILVGNLLIRIDVPSLFILVPSLLTIDVPSRLIDEPSRLIDDFVGRSSLLPRDEAPPDEVFVSPLDWEDMPAN